MKKIKNWKKILLSVFIICVLIVGGVFGYGFYKLNKINTVEISKTDDILGIKSNALSESENAKGITNIAFFGIDRMDANQKTSRSDSIIIVSIDSKNKKIKMSSIMRDTYVKIKGHGQTKITHAYAYGGPQLAISTINENFNLNIRDYITLDFFSFEKIIDTIGDVSIDIKQDEISPMNDKIVEISKIEKKSVPKITKPGLQTLNGLQVVAYSRVRFTEGGDYRRIERQKTVMSIITTKIQSLGVAKFPSIVSELLPYTETSLSSIDIIKLGTKVLTSNTTTLEQDRFPVDGYSVGKTIDKVWYLVADMKSTITQLHNFIYKDIKSVPKTIQ